MFNLKNTKAQLNREKDLRKNNVGPEADDKQPITEKMLEDRGDYSMKTTESPLEEARTNDDDVQIIEKVLNSTKEWRTADDSLFVPPINTLVAKMEEDRRKDYFKTDKESHWSQTFDEKKQQAGLPKLEKNAPQHDKIVLQNDPKRLTSKEPKPLLGGITTADVDRLVKAIKTGDTLEYDAATLAILKEADAEKRELTPVEQKAIADIKRARTKAILAQVGETSFHRVPWRSIAQGDETYYLEKAEQLLQQWERVGRKFKTPYEIQMALEQSLPGLRNTAASASLVGSFKSLYEGSL